MALTPNPFKHKTPKIIDVSHWEGNPDWDKVMKADDRPEGVICKASDYYGNTPYIDKTCTYSYPILKSLGVPRGAYHYYNPEYDPTKQAEWFLQCLGNDIGEYAPIIDAEKRDYKNHSGQWVRLPKGRKNALNVQTFLDIVERKTGRIPMFYTSASWVSEYLCDWTGKNMMDNPSRYPLWIASYPGNPDLFTAPPAMAKGWTDWHLWQYSEAGVLQGFPYDGVDLNVASPLFNVGSTSSSSNPNPIPTPPPTFPKQGRVTSLASPHLNVRSGPGANFGEVPPALAAGELVTIFEVKMDGVNEWARVGDNRWCAKIYNGKVYLEFL